MYKVYIDHTDYDSPYRVDIEEKEFETITKAQEYCESLSDRRDSYDIKSTYKDNKQVNHKLLLSFERIGLEGMKEKLIRQLQEHALKVKCSKDLDELSKLLNLYLYV